VDDEPALLTAFAELIMDEGAKVSKADAAAAALELARTERFDAVISDLAMPERDGYWLARQMRNSRHLAGLPLIAVSGMARAADRQAALDAGFDAHVGKPLDLDTLRAEILGAIARRKGEV
jgi:two-component system CheB/CheR fusion protein